jgi:hypothetical protein
MNMDLPDRMVRRRTFLGNALSLSTSDGITALGEDCACDSLRRYSRISWSRLASANDRVVPGDDANDAALGATAGAGGE